MRTARPSACPHRSSSLSAGAVNSAVLLLRSANENFPAGLANRSDQVGRNFMNHNCSAVLALHPFRRNDAVYQKTFLINDFYLADGPGGAPLGNVQLLGKISGRMLAASASIPAPVAAWIAGHSVDFYAMSEDLPDPESRVRVEGDRIILDWRRSNWEAHAALVARLKSVLRRAGFPIVLARPFDRRTPSHQCGTARMGSDPATSVRRHLLPRPRPPEPLRGRCELPADLGGGEPRAHHRRSGAPRRRPHQGKDLAA